MIDPIALNDLIFGLRAAVAHRHHVDVTASTDFTRFKDVRMHLRSDPLSPYFDPKFNDESELSDAAFWLMGERDGEPVYLDAYRFYHAYGDFRQWVIGWLMRSHTLAGEDIHMIAPKGPASAFSRSIDERTVYRGELYLSPKLRDVAKSSATDDLCRLSMALAWQAFQPDAIWGLTTESRARRGAMRRIGFSYSEASFIQWTRRPDCVEENYETLVATPRDQIALQIQSGNDNDPTENAAVAIAASPVNGCNQLVESVPGF